MNASKDTIHPMAKVNLSMTIEPIQTVNSQPQRIDFSFIYGLGMAGITPFEQALHGKSPHSSVDIQVERNQAGAYFGHLSCDLMQWLSDVNSPINLCVQIVSIEAANPREVVQAMAKLGGCGDSCDCGCGCG